MNTNLEDYEGVVDRIAEDFTTPDVAGVYQIAEKRRDQRRHIQQGTAAFALLLVIAGAALWVTQPQPSEVATEPPSTSEATTTTPIEEEAVAADLSTELRDLFMSTQSWTPIARTGIPEGGDYFEAVTFQRARGSDTVFFESCATKPPYLIDWESDGFTVTGKDLQAELETRGCDQPGEEGIANTPIQSGEKVTATSNNDGTYTLAGNAWTLTITPMTQPATDPEPAVTTTTTEAPTTTTTIQEDTTTTTISE